MLFVLFCFFAAIFIYFLKEVMITKYVQFWYCKSLVGKAYD